MLVEGDEMTQNPPRSPVPLTRPVRPAPSPALVGAAAAGRGRATDRGESTELVFDLGVDR